MAEDTKQEDKPVTAEDTGGTAVKEEGEAADEIKENNLDHEVILSESDVIGHQKVEIKVDGNLLQSKWATIGNVKAETENEAPRDLLVYPTANNSDTKFNELYKDESPLKLKVDFNNNKPSGIYLYVNENDIFNNYALIVGPKDTPYFGGFYFFKIKFIE